MAEQIGLARWLKERCQKDHLSLRQVGEMAGISHSTVHSIFKGGHSSAATVKRLAHAFGGNGNQQIALEDELLILAGYRTRQEHLSQPLAELIDILSHFSEPQLKVVSAFASYLTEVSRHGKQ